MIYIDEKPKTKFSIILNRILEKANLILWVMLNFLIKYDGLLSIRQFETGFKLSKSISAENY